MRCGAGRVPAHVLGRVRQDPPAPVRTGKNVPVRAGENRPAEGNRFGGLFKQGRRPDALELVADGPNQVWSWDITKLKGPARGIWFHLYVIIDIYSRKAIHWEAWPTETGILAREFIEHAIEANGGMS